MDARIKRRGVCIHFFSRCDAMKWSTLGQVLLEEGCPEKVWHKTYHVSSQRQKHSHLSADWVSRSQTRFSGWCPFGKRMRDAIPCLYCLPDAPIYGICPEKVFSTEKFHYHMSLFAKKRGWVQATESARHRLLTHYFIYLYLPFPFRLSFFDVSVNQQAIRMGSVCDYIVADVATIRNTILDPPDEETVHPFKCSPKDFDEILGVD